VRGLLLLAASGLAREVAAAAQREYGVVGILDDNPELQGDYVGGIPVLGGIELAAQRQEALLVCVGSGAARRRMVWRLRDLGVTDDRYATVIDDSVRVPQGCTIDRGSILLANTVLTTNVTIGSHVVVMPNVTLTHDNVLEDYATLTSGVSLGGSVIVGEASYLGMNASVRQNVWVGAGSVVGMGAVLLTDVPAGETWVGVPARVQRQRAGS
jgi:sugar O-acyltransferase (sialic acid O-acetyltransferase NeuD family)